jgi:hypothetical protein
VVWVGWGLGLGGWTGCGVGGMGAGMVWMGWGDGQGAQSWGDGAGWGDGLELWAALGCAGLGWGWGMGRAGMRRAGLGAGISQRRLTLDAFAPGVGRSRGGEDAIATPVTRVGPATAAERQVSRFACAGSAVAAALAACKEKVVSACDRCAGSSASLAPGGEGPGTGDRGAPALT